MLMLELNAYIPPPYVALCPLIIPPFTLTVDSYAYIPPPYLTVFCLSPRISPPFRFTVLRCDTIIQLFPGNGPILVPSSIVNVPATSIGLAENWQGVPSGVILFIIIFCNVTSPRIYSICDIVLLPGRSVTFSRVTFLLMSIGLSR